MNLIKNDGTKNSVILDKVTPKLLTEKIADNEEEAHFIVNRMLMDKYFEKIIKVDFDKDKSNPIIKLLTSNEKEKLLLEEKDKERAKHYKYYTGKDWKDYSHYDIALNVDKFGIQNTVETIKNIVLNNNSKN